MSYGQKTVLENMFFRKIVHKSVSNPSPGMILVAKLIILTKVKFTKPQNCPGRLGEAKNDIRKNLKIVKIGQNLAGRGPLATLKGPFVYHSPGPGGFFHLHPLIGGSAAGRSL